MSELSDEVRRKEKKIMNLEDEIEENDQTHSNLNAIVKDNKKAISAEVNELKKIQQN